MTQNGAEAKLTDDLMGLARDAAYVAIGLGVLGFQRAQVERVALRKKLEEADLPVEDIVAGVRAGVSRQLAITDQVAAGVRSEVARQMATVDQWVERTTQVVEATLEPFEDRLPAPARQIARTAHDQVRELRAQIRSRITSA